jgi:lysozyme family protein
MAITFETARAGYRAMFDKMVVEPGRVAALDSICKRILARKADYERVEAAIGTPWYFVAAIHYRESDLDFKTHLHNGDSLAERTHHVPAGRPVAMPASGHFPYEWFESAIDALKQRGLDKIKDWPVERVGFETEEYNGDGYEKFHNENSPYNWAWTNLQQVGKYDSDGHFNDSMTDTQCGTMPIIQKLMPVAPIQPVPAPVPAPQPAPAPIQPAPVAVTPPPPAPIPAPQPTKDTPPMTTVTLPSFSSFPFASIEAQIKAVLPMLGTVAFFVPALAPVVPMVEVGAPFAFAVLTVLASIQADIAAGKSFEVALVDGLRSLATQINNLPKP